MCLIRYSSFTRITQIDLSPTSLEQFLRYPRWGLLGYHPFALNKTQLTALRLCFFQVDRGKIDTKIPFVSLIYLFNFLLYKVGSFADAGGLSLAVEAEAALVVCAAGLLIHGCLLAEHRLQARAFSSCSFPALECRLSGCGAQVQLPDGQIRLAPLSGTELEHY